MTNPGGQGPTASGPPVEPPDDRRATVVGAVLVVAALLVGFVLLAKGFSDDGGLVATDSNSAQSADGGNGEGFVIPTNETTIPVIDPTSVKAFVANASGTKTGARQVADLLIAAGLVAPQIGNAPNQVQSVVYYTAGNEAQAKLVAADLGIDSALVLVLPTPSPVTDLKGATVLVVIGTDGKLAVGATTTTTAGSTRTTTTTTTP
ncbi:MAG: LytR C-terminal domain-containing protein [Actinomycetes bacterium]